MDSSRLFDIVFLIYVTRSMMRVSKSAKTQSIGSKDLKVSLAFHLGFGYVLHYNPRHRAIESNRL